MIFDVLPDLLEQYPLLLAALALAMRAVLAYQRSLTWYEYRTLHGLKRLLLPRLGVGINGKGGREDAEYIATVEQSPRQTVSTLREAGAVLHLVCSLKRRPERPNQSERKQSENTIRKRDQYTYAHLIWEHGDDQTEAYLFANADGTTDIFSHFEPGPETPLEHLGGEQQADGDPRGVVTAALEEGKQ
jgi:hypothetical protein